MWLLDTRRAELHFFHSPEIGPPYAILSHVWTDHEQSFHDTQHLARTKNVRNPRDLSHGKVRNACSFAELHGYSWLWFDTCCIDQTSSAELSEAINSMYRYYACADVCYAYLADVPSADWQSAFMESEWHKRGWTLQELLAPRQVLFLSQTWEPLDYKWKLADMLSRITGIPAAVLRMEERVQDVSIATRMSWAAERTTTRPEDEAYSLMGIFGINLPMIYGEGREGAFFRLQQEIMKQSTDTTLFAWGLTDLEDTWDNRDSIAIQDSARCSGGLHTEEMCLFASSPSAFKRKIGDLNLTIVSQPVHVHILLSIGYVRFANRDQLLPCRFLAKAIPDSRICL